MRISKPDDLLILLYRGRIAGERVLAVTVGYAVGADGQRLPEVEVWPWLKDCFGKQPFDVGMPKSRGTVAVHGAACAPGGTPVDEMAIRVRCATVDKELLVFGDRTWTRTLVGQWRATDAQAFTRMPVTLDRAYGGAGYAENPEGRGYLPDSGAAEGVALPNIQHPDRLCLTPKDRPPPAALGPLPQEAPSRTRHLGRFDGTWRRQDFPFVPRDSDPRYFDAVPEDQCLPGFFRGDESWSVEGMHPRQPRVEGRLPGLRLRLLARFGGAEADDAAVIEAPMQLDTVWLFPGDERAIALHRACIAVTTDDASDVSELGLFLERLDEAPASREALIAAWPRTKAPEYDPGKMAALQAADDEKRAQLAATAAAVAKPDPRWTKFGDDVWADISQSYETAVADAQKQAERAGLPFERPPPLSRPVPVETARAPVDWPAFSAEIERDLATSLKDAETQTRKALTAHGIDPDEAMAKAAAQSAQPVDPMASIDQAPLPASVKADVKGRMAALQQEIAGIEEKIDAMSKEFAKRAGAAAAAAPLAVTAGGASAGAAGTEMDRDTLLARYKAGEPVAGAQVTHQDLSDIDLSGADLSGARFVDCRMPGAKLSDATLTGAQFQRCDLSRADCSKVVADGISAENCVAASTVFAGAVLKDSRWQDCDLTRTDLSGADAKAAVFNDCKLNGAQLDGFKGVQAQWTRCDLGAASGTGADFSQAQWTEVVLDDTALDGATLDGAMLWTVRGRGTRLTGANLRGVRMGGGTSLHRANLADADLSDASLQDTALVAGQLQRAACDRALFLRCDLTTVDAYRAIARRADFRSSVLKDTRWKAANLMEAGFCGATLDGVDMTGANLFATETFGARLDRVVLTDAYTARSGFEEIPA